MIEIKNNFHLILIIVIGFIFSTNVAFGQISKESLAVYVSGSGDENIKKVIGSKLVSAITKYSDDYAAVERTADFLAKLREEQQYQYSGNVDDNQLVKLGKHFGVKFIVVADVMDVLGSYFVSARMINVETGLVIITADGEKTLGTASDLVSLAEEVASKLVKSSRKDKLVNDNATTTSLTNAQQTQAITIYGYLKVFPEDLGEFTTSPDNVISIINKDSQHGYNDWRLPTEEELALMKANRTQIRLMDENYMTSDGQRIGHVRLVSTGKLVAEKIDEQQQKEEKLKNEPFTWGFEIASEDISSIEARNKESVCPSGWRLPNGQEMKLIVSNPYTKVMLKRNTYWIAGDGGDYTVEIEEKLGRDGNVLTPSSKRYYTYYVYYNVSNNNTNSIKIHTKTSYDGYYYAGGYVNSVNTTKSGWIDAREVNVSSQTEYHTCRCVRDKTANNSSNKINSSSSPETSSLPTDPKEQYDLAGKYYGLQEYLEAEKWYRKSAEQGYAESQYMLGTMYQYGWGVTKNNTEAIDWYKKAAKLGNKESQRILKSSGINWE